MEWVAASGGGAVTDDTVMVGNGTAGVEATVPACAGSTSKLLYDQVTNTFSCGTDQTGASAAIDCTDPANSCLWDDFYDGAATSGNISSLAWRRTGSTGSFRAGEDGAPGIFRVGTNTALDNSAALQLSAWSSSEPLISLDNKTFTLQMRFRMSRTTTIGAHVGIKDDGAAGANGYGFFVSFDTSTSDTAYQYFVCNSTCTSISSGAAPTTLWRRVKITNDGGSIVTFSLYDETGTLITGSTKTFCSAASGCDTNSVSFPAGGATLEVNYIVVNRAATTAATLDAEFFSFQMTGLSR